ncbi:glutamyl-tRNA reductase [Fusibacter paucivorans]|uniref:Glutamyl-tRNA reductase n=1 Tax=Fusibacter paucivorans TaxID=76009 RepID=A0ABS5PPQ4_9FIRM|nr:glutamyl-tRNA reductase [Fusibacter paucivorans]MBS7527155.1 glutamyl-tRNA reductase [Fusibacter paucivorans]
MQIGLIGLNHQTATIEQREQFCMTESAQSEWMAYAKRIGVLEIVILSTCGRFEVYYVTSADAFDAISTTLFDALVNTHASAEVMNANTIIDNSQFYQKSGFQAVNHLFKVTAGLDSAVLGEDQILGQVKNAIAAATELDYSGKILNKLFRVAVSFSKRIKTELKISQTPLSLSYIAIKNAVAAGYLSDETVITMVGLGKMGGLAIKYLFEAPFKTIYVAVRHPENLPIDILTHKKVRIVPFESRYECIAISHLVVSSTGAPHAVIRRNDVKGIKDGMLMIDLAVPRDIADDLYQIENIAIWTVDSLKEVSDENYQKRHELIAHVEALIFDEVNDFVKWVEATKVDDLLGAWNQTIADIKDGTMSILSRKLHTQNPADMATIDKLVESSLKKMIKSPLESLKVMENNEKREQYIQMLKELYGYES